MSNYRKLFINQMQFKKIYKMSNLELIEMYGMESETKKRKL